MTFTDKYLSTIYNNLSIRYPEQKEYLQAVSEVFSSIEPALEKHPEYEKENIVGRIVEPERVIFSVFRGWMITEEFRSTANIEYSSIRRSAPIKADCVSVTM